MGVTYPQSGLTSSPRPNGEYVVYADESGDHSLTSINPDYPIFVLALCVFERKHYEASVTRWSDRFKMKHCGTIDVVLHERDIRKAVGDFAFLTDAEKRDSFMSDLGKLMGYLRYKLIAAAIRKLDLDRRYVNPTNPYHLSAGFCLERLAMCLKHEHGCRAGRCEVVFERRGGKEDTDLELEFRRICDGDNKLGERLPFDIRFESKIENTAGIQFADMVARPIGRHVLDPAQSNRAYDILEGKFRRSWRGKVEGYGLKVFP